MFLRGVRRCAFSTKTGASKYVPPTLESIGRTKHPLLPLRMTLLGAPGSGKGSIGKYIAKYFNDIPIISTGLVCVRCNTMQQQLLSSLLLVSAAAAFGFTHSFPTVGSRR